MGGQGKRGGNRSLAAPAEQQGQGDGRRQKGVPLAPLRSPGSEPAARRRQVRREGVNRRRAKQAACLCSSTNRAERRQSSQGTAVNQAPKCGKCRHREAAPERRHPTLPACLVGGAREGKRESQCGRAGVGGRRGLESLAEQEERGPACQHTISVAVPLGSWFMGAGSPLPCMNSRQAASRYKHMLRARG